MARIKDRAKTLR